MDAGGQDIKIGLKIFCEICQNSGIQDTGRTVDPTKVGKDKKFSLPVAGTIMG